MSPTDAELHARARELIQQGQLPETCDSQVWAGPGTGTPCCLCNEVIALHQMEYEIEAGQGTPAGRLRFHLCCHTIWETECTGASSVDFAARLVSLPDTALENGQGLWPPEGVDSHDRG